MSHDYTLLLCCPDRVGVTAAVSGFIAEHNGWITESDQHSDPDAGNFLTRIQIRADSLPFGVEEFRERFAPIAENFGMSWRVHDNQIKKRVVILVSKYDHCLVDLLYRWRTQEFQFDVPCVISNHNDMRDFVEWHNIPYHHIPVTPETKEEAHEKIAALYEEYQGDTMVLARYMQILPPWMTERFPNQIINIHHSFLPSFVGAKPYERAFERGVKLIGATCHYVTAELDAGPIIEQDVVRVDHRDTAQDMIRLGKDVEKLVLARGLQNHVEDRVLAIQRRTVIMR